MWKEEKALTVEELRQMAGQPVWCPEENSYGIVMCDDGGRWAGIPFLHGVWYKDGCGFGVEFNYSIPGRKLKCYRVLSDKETAIEPKQTAEGTAGNTLVCLKCGRTDVCNPYAEGEEVYPYCPWCGQKLKKV